MTTVLEAVGAPAGLVELGSAEASTTETELRLAEGLRFSEWWQLGEKLASMHDSLRWWRGDWRRYGERFRREHPQALLEHEPQLGLFETDGFVAGRVDADVRVPELSWEHHRVVAALEAGGQRYWLGEAVRQGWSVGELRAAVAESSERRARPSSLTLRAVGELHDLCLEASARLGRDPADWAAEVLEREARRVLAEVAAPAALVAV